MRLDLSSRRFAVGRFDAEQHEVRALHGTGLGACGHLHEFIEGLGFQP